MENSRCPRVEIPRVEKLGISFKQGVAKITRAYLLDADKPPQICYSIWSIIAYWREGIWIKPGGMNFLKKISTIASQFGRGTKL